MDIRVLVEFVERVSMELASCSTVPRACLDVGTWLSGRVPVSEAGGREFNSPRPYSFELFKNLLWQTVALMRQFAYVPP